MSEVCVTDQRKLFVVQVPSTLGPVNSAVCRELGLRALSGAQVADRYEVTGPDFEVCQLCAPDRGLTAATFRYRTGGGAYLLAEHVGGRLEIVAAEDTLEDALERLCDDACDDCGAYNADGEGYDGLCGDCADRAEGEGRWD